MNDNFRLGKEWADTGTLSLIPKKYRVSPTTTEASSLAIAVGASIKAMLTDLEAKEVKRAEVRKAVEAVWEASDPVLAIINSMLPHPVAGPARVDFVKALHELMAVTKEST
jgi:hypothetical protein